MIEKNTLSQAEKIVLIDHIRENWEKAYQFQTDEEIAARARATLGHMYTPTNIGSIRRALGHHRQVRNGQTKKVVLRELSRAMLEVQDLLHMTDSRTRATLVAYVQKKAVV